MPDRVKVLFDRDGQDAETAWCMPLAAAHRYRLDNILFFHPTPVCGDEIEAREVDGQLAFRKITKASGRHVVVIDYPREDQFKSLTTFLRTKLESACEACYPAADGEPGRLYIAAPEHFSPEQVIVAAQGHTDGITAIEPAQRTRKPAAATPASKPTSKSKSKSKAKATAPKAKATQKPTAKPKAKAKAKAPAKRRR